MSLVTLFISILLCIESTSAGLSSYLWSRQTNSSQNAPSGQLDLWATLGRSYFFVGGSYNDSDPDPPPRRGRMYVEKLSPQGGATQKNPIVFFHGGGGTGALWLNTPDNRPGWASYFINRGYEVYLVDWPFIGRSDRPSDIQTTSFGISDVENSFTAPGPQLYPQAALHTQWPGTGKRNDTTFEAFFNGFTLFPSNYTNTEPFLRKAGCALLELINLPTFLVGHSIGSLPLLLIADECPTRVKGWVGVEPDNTPSQNCDSSNCIPVPKPYALTYTPIAYTPPVTENSSLATTIVGNDTKAYHACVIQTEPVRNLTYISQVPAYVITGEASIHVTYDHCEVNYLRQAGVDVTWDKLADRGIHGNGHFMFLEENNIDIAKLVDQWMSGLDTS